VAAGLHTRFHETLAERLLIGVAAQDNKMVEAAATE
jgi:hypothetical protein